MPYHSPRASRRLNCDNRSPSSKSSTLAKSPGDDYLIISVPLRCKEATRVWLRFESSVVSLFYRYRVGNSALQVCLHSETPCSDFGCDRLDKTSFPTGRNLKSGLSLEFEARRIKLLSEKGDGKCLKASIHKLKPQVSLSPTLKAVLHLPFRIPTTFHVISYSASVLRTFSNESFSEMF